MVIKGKVQAGVDPASVAAQFAPGADLASLLVVRFAPGADLASIAVGIGREGDNIAVGSTNLN